MAGRGGTTGAAGTTGVAGTTGTGGRGGTTGAAGRGGTTGAAGTIGSAGAGGPVNLDGKKALFILDDPGSPDDGDIVLRQLMEVRGMTVTYGPPTGPATLASGQNVVIVSSGASASEFAPVFKDVAVPMIVFGNSAYQNLGWIAASSGRGTVESNLLVSIIDANTPLASDLPTGTGFKLVLDSRDTSLYWGTPGGSPIRVASVMGQPTQMVAFAYERGAAMATGTAAARRVGLAFRTDVAQDVTIEGYKLLMAAIEWTAGSN